MKYRAAATQPAKEPKPAAEKEEEALDRTKLWLSKPRIHRRHFKDDWKLTELTAICTAGDSAADRRMAERIQGLIEDLYGIRLPVDPSATTRPFGKETKGVVFVGKAAALASGLVTEADFKAAGEEGVVIRGVDGRVAFAATREKNLPNVIEAWMYILRRRHGPVPSGGMPKPDRPVIREFTLIDWPPFGAVCPPPKPYRRSLAHSARRGSMGLRAAPLRSTLSARARR